MTAAAAAGGHDEYRGWRKHAMLLGHLHSRWSTYAPALLLAAFIPYLWLPPHGAIATGFDWVIRPLITVFIAGQFAAMSVHDRGMCLKCLDQAFPGEPEIAVNQARGRLLYYHRHGRRLNVGMMSAVGAILLAFPIKDVHILSAPAFVANIAATALVAAAGAVLTAAFRCVDTHRRLQAWCPYCHRRGGEDDTTPAPTPQPVATA